MPFDPDEYPTVTIEVHFCDVCGAIAKEEIETWENGVPDQVHSYYVQGIVLTQCETCGLLACESCRDDSWCCDRRAEIENEGRPKAGQQEMFDE